MDARIAVKILLASLGQDPDREGLRDTPTRVVKALREMTSGYDEDPADVLSRDFEETADELVVCKGVDFVSLCEHHLMPFTGVAHVGYLPRGKVVGLSKLARLVDIFARRLQIQERMTSEIAHALMDNTDAKSVAVVVDAHHACMSCRGVRKAGARMVTSAVLGEMRTNTAQRAEFLALVGP